MYFCEKYGKQVSDGREKCHDCSLAEHSCIVCGRLEWPFALDSQFALSQEFLVLQPRGLIARGAMRTSP